MYKSLQASRALAAIFVVLFHLGSAIASEKYFGITRFSIPFSFGSAGVEFFFVLSGFIILTAHKQDLFKANQLPRYLTNRFLRIYPTYWIILLSIFCLASFFPSLAHIMPQDFFAFFKTLMLVPTYEPFLAVTWSLYYELFFYLCFALFMLNKRLCLIMGLPAIYLYITFCSNTFFSTHYLFLFLMGMMVSLICFSKKNVSKHALLWLSIGVTLFILVAADTLLQSGLIPQYKTIVYGLASSIIIFGLVQSEKMGIVIGKHHGWQVLGNASYVLYLIHYPVISILCKLALMIKLNTFGIWGAAFSYLFIFATCLISSVLFHLYVEKPVILHLRSKKITLAGFIQIFRLLPKKQEVFPQKN